MKKGALVSLCGVIALGVAYYLGVRSPWGDQVRIRGGMLQLNELQIVAPGSLEPSVLITASPDGQGSIVVKGRQGRAIAVHIGVDDADNGLITVFMPDDERGGKARIISISSESGISLSGHGPVLWELGVDSSGGTVRLSRNDGAVFLKGFCDSNGQGALQVLDQESALRAIK